MKTITLISLIVIGLLSCGLTYKPVTYSKQTVSYTVKSGDTGHHIAYQFMDRQNKYDDVREFWFYISKDSNLDKSLPLQAGQELTINLYNSRR